MDYTVSTSGNYTPNNTLIFNNGWTDEKDETFLNYLRRDWLLGLSHDPNNSFVTKGQVDFSQVGQSILVDKVV